MEIKKETICEDTMYIIKQYYHLDPDPLFSILAEDCVWLSIGNLTVYGAEAIKAQFKDGFLMPAFDIKDPIFREIKTHSDEQLIVLGEYTLNADDQSNTICTARQRLTFCYRLTQQGYRLFHMHVSNEYNELVDDEIFPFQITKQTYQYVQDLLKKSAKNNRQKIAVKENSSISFIDTGMIQYVQALERESILHLVNEKRQIQTPIKELKKDLPAYFYPLHRSYFVNCNYVARIERYRLTLITGEVLPIPKMRFSQVRNEIMEIIQKKQQKPLK